MLVRKICDTVEHTYAHMTKYGVPLRLLLVWGSLRLAPIVVVLTGLVVRIPGSLTQVAQV